jgi:cation-transporting ATPase E
MVPQGLVLLTTIAFGVAAVTLARRQVLVQELPAVEGLARVDVVCFDKTGTLTDGTIVFDRIELDEAPIEAALSAFAQDDSPNATLAAVARAFPSSDGWARTAAIPFSSARKWSAASFGPRGTWVLGAPEMVWQQRPGRELSHGTRTQDGEHFIERALSASVTCRLQRRSLFA